MPLARGWQQVEGAGLALAGLMVAGLAAPGWPWWVWFAALLAPDLALAGYLAGPRAGGFVYNLVHLYAPPLILVLLGVSGGSLGAMAAGGLWLAHAGADRALGFGLKLSTGFRDTHLGRIGPES